MYSLFPSGFYSIFALGCWISCTPAYDGDLSSSWPALELVNRTTQETNQLNIITGTRFSDIILPYPDFHPPIYPGKEKAKVITLSKHPLRLNTQIKITKSNLEIQKLDQFFCDDNFSFAKERRLVSSQHKIMDKKTHQHGCQFFITISLLNKYQTPLSDSFSINFFHFPPHKPKIIETVISKLYYLT